VNGSTRCRNVRPPRVFRGIFAGFAFVFGVAALALVLLALAGLPSSRFVSSALAAIGAVVFGGLGWMMLSVVRRRAPALTVGFCPDAITMSRRRLVTDTIRRDEVGLVIIKAYGRAGVGSIEIYGPDRSLVGRWDTNWGAGAGAIRSMRALRRLQYPWVLHDAGAVVWQDKFRSPLAPTWTDEVVRP
jgi:hypothetical protein